MAEDLEAMDKLEQLEGRLVAEAHEDVEVVELIAEEDLEMQVHGTLREHYGAWVEAGAGSFVLGVIREGFRLNLCEEPGMYEEKNNRSFEQHKEFAVEAIKKLVKLKIVLEVSRKEVDCINPLTVAVNAKGKKRLCIDLSRNVNQCNEAIKFKIESTVKFLQVVNKEDYLWVFDLKSAYHQIPIYKQHWKFLGLSVKMEGIKRYFIFTSLPFGLNDAARALTKLLKFPLWRWRQWGAKAFIHLDDGIGALARRKNAQNMSDKVKLDLRKFGLLTSEDKCTWTVTQCIEWTGWIIDLRSRDQGEESFGESRQVVGVGRQESACQGAHLVGGAYHQLDTGCGQGSKV